MEDETRKNDSELLNYFGLQRIEVALDHPQGVFYSGHDVTGKVYVEVDSPKDILGLKLKYKGEARVHFTDRSAGIRRRFSGEQTYFNEEIYLHGGNTGDKIEISKGEGVYPFSLTLPENLPCSFEGRYGRVRYSVRAVLDVTKVYQFSSDVVYFTVAPILDLNENSVAPLPVSEDLSKTFVGQSEPVKMSVNLPVRGYVPGQTIPMKIELTNSSKVQVKKLRIVLKKVVTYHAIEKSRKHKEIIVEIEQPVCRKNYETYEIGVDVPAVPPTGMLHCGIIDVNYTLKAEAYIEANEWYYKMFQKNLKIRMNIVVGTIPLDHYENQLEETEDEEEEKSLQATNRGITVEREADESTGPTEGRITKSNDLVVPTYRRSRIYRSSKPDKDDPTGEEGDSDGEVKPYSPMYRVYKFRDSGKSNVDR